MTKRFGGNMDCKDKTSSWHLIEFYDDSNIIESTVSCRGEAHSYTGHLLHQSPCRNTKQNKDKRQDDPGYSSKLLHWV